MLCTGPTFKLLINIIYKGFEDVFFFNNSRLLPHSFSKTYSFSVSTQNSDSPVFPQQKDVLLYPLVLNEPLWAEYNTGHVMSKAVLLIWFMVKINWAETCTNSESVEVVYLLTEKRRTFTPYFLHLNLIPRDWLPVFWPVYNNGVCHSHTTKGLSAEQMSAKKWIKIKKSKICILASTIILHSCQRVPPSSF